MSQPDKRALLAEGLAAGDDDAALHVRLVAAGMSAAAAKYEIDRLGKDPMGAMLRRQAARMAKQAWRLAEPARETDGHRRPLARARPLVARSFRARRGRRRGRGAGRARTRPGL